MCFFENKGTFVGTERRAMSVGNILTALLMDLFALKS